MGAFPANGALRAQGNPTSATRSSARGTLLWSPLVSASGKEPCGSSGVHCGRGSDSVRPRMRPDVRGDLRRATARWAAYGPKGRSHRRSGQETRCHSRDTQCAAFPAHRGPAARGLARLTIPQTQAPHELCTPPNTTRHHPPGEAGVAVSAASFMAGPGGSILPPTPPPGGRRADRDPRASLTSQQTVCYEQAVSAEPGGTRGRNS